MSPASREELIAHNSYLCGIGFGIVLCGCAGLIVWSIRYEMARQQERESRAFVDNIVHGPVKPKEEADPEAEKEETEVS